MSINCRDSSYIIKKVDNQTEEIVVNKGQINQSALDITLLGKRRREYGEFFNENLLRILENFSSPEDSSNPGNPDPSSTSGGVLANPTTGQLWHNSTDNRIYHFTGFEWKPLGELGDVAGNHGTILSGEQLPRPVSQFTGYVFPYEECSWVVAPAFYPSEITYMACYTDEEANVTFEFRREGEAELTPGLVFYQIIGIRDNNSLGVQVSPTPPPSLSPTPTPTPTPTSSVTTTPSASPSATSTPTPTPTSSVTTTPGVSLSATPTPTPTSSVTTTPGASLSATPTPTPTSTNTPTPTPTSSVTPSQSVATFGNVVSGTYNPEATGDPSDTQLSIRVQLDPDGFIRTIRTVNNLSDPSMVIGQWVTDPNNPAFVAGDYTYTTIVSNVSPNATLQQPSPASGGNLSGTVSWELNVSGAGSGVSMATIEVTLTPGGSSSSFTGGTITFNLTVEKT